MQTQTQHKKVMVANERGEMIGSEYMLIAIEKGMIRCASRVYVFNDSGQVLIQRRGANVHKPLMLDPSVGGHVDEGETYLEAALREMEEELGLRGFELKLVVEGEYSRNFFSYIYKTVIPDNTLIQFDQEEVAEVIWLHPEEVDSLIEEKADECTSSLKDSWTSFRDRLISA